MWSEEILLVSPWTWNALTNDMNRMKREYRRAMCRGRQKQYLRKRQERRRGWKRKLGKLDYCQKYQRCAADFYCQTALVCYPGFRRPETAV